MLTIAPPPRSSSRRYRQPAQLEGGDTLKWNEDSSWPTVVSRNGRDTEPPALLTTMSRRPKLVDGRVDGRRQLLGVVDVAGHRLAAAPGGTDPFGHVVEVARCGR